MTQSKENTDDGMSVLNDSLRDMIARLDGSED